MSTNPYVIGALVLAPAVALASIGLRRHWQLAVVLIVVGIIGWGLLLASAAWTDAKLAATFDSIPRPTPEQIREFNADGASKTALFLFGFPISLLYALIWFAVVRIGRSIARRAFHA